MVRHLLNIIFLLVVVVGFSQETPKDTITDYYVRFEGDSILRSSIELDEVFIFSKLEFANRNEKLRYYILRRKTLKVYPYAKLAAERLVELNDSLTKIKKRRQKKRYTKKVQKYIEGEFSEELKKLTRTEGQILVKLIYRQTGKTAFSLVKELRSGWRAFWYNTTAKAFKISIKEEFHPERIHEDYLIEDILQRAFAAKRLERQESVLDYDYALLSNKWKNPNPIKN
ncbi:DUF4294 domain-containing protein [Flagellimonas allohymeniacidonis]|uniref:DUF4294 domain-containing protein n=1 Tax=Flagellimonas allohymeniacidonis TaxID=2517819 RepID=A0A4Q8QF58_9FLAO|nr:DUF4294 domain-containing protein [Allomuricauda hymeniacidonis]TAI49105.1 DUF4294 domain-containing protein [Allomuricauda hymeniacidonis]